MTIPSSRAGLARSEERYEVCSSFLLVALACWKEGSHIVCPECLVFFFMLDLPLLALWEGQRKWGEGDCLNLFSLLLWFPFYWLQHGRHLKAVSSEGMCVTSLKRSRVRGGWERRGCLTLSFLLCGFRLGWWSSSWVEFSLASSGPAMLCRVHLPHGQLVGTCQLSSPYYPSPQFSIFFPLEIGTEADKHICWLRSCDIEEWHTLLTLSSKLHKWFSWIPPALFCRGKYPFHLPMRRQESFFLTKWIVWLWISNKAVDPNVFLPPFSRTWLI